MLENVVFIYFASLIIKWIIIKQLSIIINYYQYIYDSL